MKFSTITLSLALAAPSALEAALIRGATGDVASAREDTLGLLDTQEPLEVSPPEINESTPMEGGIERILAGKPLTVFTPRPRSNHGMDFEYWAGTNVDHVPGLKRFSIESVTGNEKINTLNVRTLKNGAFVQFRDATGHNRFDWDVGATALPGLLRTERVSSGQYFENIHNGKKTVSGCYTTPDLPSFFGGTAVLSEFLLQFADDDNSNPTEYNMDLVMVKIENKKYSSGVTIPRVSVCLSDFYEDKPFTYNVKYSWIDNDNIQGNGLEHTRTQYSRSIEDSVIARSPSGTGKVMTGFIFDSKGEIPIKNFGVSLEDDKVEVEFGREGGNLDYSWNVFYANIFE